MNKWVTERSQSMLFIGDSYQSLGQINEALAAYHEAFVIDATRREPFMRLADYYYRKNDYQRVACYCEAALQIPENRFYSNHHDLYTYKPHELLYWAHYWLGNKDKAKQHWQKAIEYVPTHPKFNQDRIFFEELPLVSIILPTLGRKEGLQRCLQSIERLEYPKERVELIVLEDTPRLGVPQRVAEGLARAKGNLIVFASNDIEFTPDSLKIAVEKSKQYGLVAFHDSPVYEDNGNICAHFLIRKDLIEKLEHKQIFSTDFNHVGCDNWLWAQADKLGEAYHCEEAKIIHNHFSKGAPMDETYLLGWEHAEEDRETLKNKLLTL
jgi:tetratricopeptide (TPR) repeat protein